MRPSRHDDHDRDPYKGQRAPVTGLIQSGISLWSGEHSLLSTRYRNKRQIALYLSYQVPCTLAVPFAIPVAVGLILLLS